MKKVYSIFLLTCVMLLTLVSCQKDSVTLKVRISTFSSPDKTYMEPVTNGCMPRWQTGDGVWINDNNSYAVTVSGQNASISDVVANAVYQAIYPADIVRNRISDNEIAIELPRVQPYVQIGGNQVVKAPMGASSHGTTLDFTNMGALLAVKILNNTNADLTRSASLVIDSIAVTSVTENTPLWGEGKVQGIHTDTRRYVMEPEDVNNIEKYYTVSLGGISGVNLSRSTNVSDAKILYMYIPASTDAVLNRFEVKVYAHNPTSGTFVYTRTQTISGQGNIALGNFACVPMYLGAEDCVEAFTATAIPDGALDSRFTINANNGQIYFASGNLVYANSLGVFKFAESQYSIVGDANSDPVHAELIDLFGWGTSGYHDPADTYSTRYMPYETATSTVNSTNNTTGYGPSKNNTTGVELSSHYQYDWGSKISTSDTWRTFTNEEWEYLVHTRTNAIFGGQSNTLDDTMSYRRCKVELEDGTYMDGIVIFPDNFRGHAQLIHVSNYRTPSGTVSRYGRGYDENNYPIFNQADIDNNGIVFLPTTGTRGQNSSTRTADKYAPTGFSYWTANTARSGTGAITHAQALAINISGVATKTIRYTGCAVRLVIDCAE